MIRFDSIKATDFGGHRSFQHKIKGNVLGLSGVSGAGKSTILQLIEWLTVGKIDHKNKPITSWVRRSAAEEIKKTEASGTLTIDGKPLTIARSASLAGTSTRSVVWDGQKPVTAAAAVEDLLSNLFGASLKTVSSLVFIRQGSFGLLFSGLDSDRREFFVRLLALGHLEKVAGIVDTYRKQMMGSAPDMTVLKDQAETTYHEARKYFEEVDDAISRMRSYAGDITAGLELSGALDQVASREGELATRRAAVVEGMAPLGLTLATYDLWLATADAELARLRESLVSTVNRRKTRAAYGVQQMQLSADIVAINNWLEKKTQRDALQTQLDAMQASEGAPDPRVRIAKLDAWEEAYRERESYRADMDAMPVTDAARESALEGAYNVAVQASADASKLWNQALQDSRDLAALSAVSGSNAGDASCRLCGNEHPDPKFLAIAIANNKDLLAKLSDDSNRAGDAMLAAKAALDTAKAEDAASLNRWNNLKSRLAEIEASLVGAPDGASLVVERDQLSAALPAYDAAKSMRAHLTTQRDAIYLGADSWTPADAAQKQVDLELTEQLLNMLPPAEDIEQTERELTEQGVALKTQRDGLAALVGNFQTADDDYKRQHSRLAEVLTRCTADKPFLVSAIGALGPVTSTNVAAVLADLRERQSKFDAQTGIVATANRAMNTAGAALQEIETRIAEQQARITIGKELEAVRGAFMPTGITTDYIAHQFARIAVVTQDHLAQMSADFMVVASESRALSFDFLRLNEPGGAWLDQDMMSGGQQVKLAIAIILAIHELIIPQVGLLVLDEPSTHLDLDSRVALAEVIKEIGRRGNFQLIVCDHSPELKDAYDDVIELTV